MVAKPNQNFPCLTNPLKLDLRFSLNIGHQFNCMNLANGIFLASCLAGPKLTLTDQSLSVFRRYKSLCSHSQNIRECFDIRKGQSTSIEKFQKSKDF